MFIEKSSFNKIIIGKISLYRIRRGIYLSILSRFFSPLIILSLFNFTIFYVEGKEKPTTPPFSLLFGEESSLLPQFPFNFPPPLNMDE